MKGKRQTKILEIIANYEVTTQEELADRLNAEGFRVTQATVSRDIRELHLYEPSLEEVFIKLIMSEVEK